VWLNYRGLTIPAAYPVRQLKSLEALSFDSAKIREWQGFGFRVPPRSLPNHERDPLYLSGKVLEHLRVISPALAEASTPPVVYLEEPADPQPGYLWMLPDTSLRVFCTDGKWRGVYVFGAREGELYDLPAEGNG
jgi:hypothetical protein